MRVVNDEQRSGTGDVRPEPTMPSVETYAPAELRRLMVAAVEYATVAQHPELRSEAATNVEKTRGFYTNEQDDAKDALEHVERVSFYCKGIVIPDHDRFITEVTHMLGSIRTRPVSAEVQPGDDMDEKKFSTRDLLPFRAASSPKASTERLFDEIGCACADVECSPEWGFGERNDGRREGARACLRAVTKIRDRWLRRESPLKETSTGGESHMPVETRPASADRDGRGERPVAQTGAHGSGHEGANVAPTPRSSTDNASVTFCPRWSSPVGCRNVFCPAKEPPAACDCGEEQMRFGKHTEGCATLGPGGNQREHAQMKNGDRVRIKGHRLEARAEAVDRKPRYVAVCTCNFLAFYPGREGHLDYCALRQGALTHERFKMLCDEDAARRAADISSQARLCRYCSAPVRRSDQRCTGSTSVYCLPKGWQGLCGWEPSASDRPSKAWGCGNGPEAYCMAVGEPCSDHAPASSATDRAFGIAPDFPLETDSSSVACTCGSGGHPRECVKHPLAKELHCAEMSLENVSDELAHVQEFLAELNAFAWASLPPDRSHESPAQGDLRDYLETLARVMATAGSPFKSTDGSGKAKGGE